MSQAHGPKPWSQLVDPDRLRAGSAMRTDFMGCILCLVRLSSPRAPEPTEETLTTNFVEQTCAGLHCSCYSRNIVRARLHTCKQGRSTCLESMPLKTNHVPPYPSSLCLACMGIAAIQLPHPLSQGLLAPRPSIGQRSPRRPPMGLAHPHAEDTLRPPSVA